MSTSCWAVAGRGHQTLRQKTANFLKLFERNAGAQRTGTSAHRLISFRRGSAWRDLVTHSLVTDADSKTDEPTHAHQISEPRPPICFTAWHRQAKHATERDEMGKRRATGRDLRSNHHTARSFILLGARQLPSPHSHQLPNCSYSLIRLAIALSHLFLRQCNGNRDV